MVHRDHRAQDAPTPRSVPTVVLIRDALSLHVDFRRPLILFYGPCWQTFADSTTQVPNFLSTLMTGTFGSGRSACYKHLPSLQQPPDQSTLNSSPPRFRCGEPLAKTPPELQDKIKVKLSCLGGHLQIDGDIEPSYFVLGEQASTEKRNNASGGLPPRLPTSTVAQTVNDLLTVYVGAASQHVLRMSFVPEREAQNFDTQVMTFESHLIQRDVASPLFFLPLKLG